MPSGEGHITWMFVVVSRPSSSGARYGAKPAIGAASVVYVPMAEALPLLPMALTASIDTVKLRPDASGDTTDTPPAPRRAHAIREPSNAWTMKARPSRPVATSHVSTESVPDVVPVAVEVYATLIHGSSDTAPV